MQIKSSCQLNTSKEVKAAAVTRHCQNSSRMPTLSQGHKNKPYANSNNCTYPHRVNKKNAKGLYIFRITNQFVIFLQYEQFHQRKCIAGTRNCFYLRFTKWNPLRETESERESLLKHMFREVLFTRGASWSKLSVNRELGGRT